MSAGAVAGVKRSWRPVSRMVLWQLQGTKTASGAGVAPRGMSTATSGGISSTSWLSGGTIQNYSVIRAVSSFSFSAAGGEQWQRSMISPPHVRFSSGSSNALRKDEEEQQQEEKPKEVKKAEWLDANKLEKSNYWGVTSKEYTREDGTKWPWCFRPTDTYSPDLNVDLHKHRDPTKFDEKLALLIVKILKAPTVFFYQKRYGCRAMMLETVAAVPGMVGGMLLHLRSLRKFEHSGGWIKALLDEAENERMHLMTLMDIVQPVWYERALVVAVQGVFFNFYFLLYLFSPRLAHRVTGYLEEEAIISYTTYLEGIDNGTVENVPAPPIAVDYWRLPKDASFRDVVVALRADEAHHRDVNHYAADIRHEGKQLHESPAPVDYH